MASTLRPWVALFTAALLLFAPSFAFQSSLSDQAVREAYFLGQRHDDSMARLLDRYTKFLPPPGSFFCTPEGSARRVEGPLFLRPPP